MGRKPTTNSIGKRNTGIHAQKNNHFGGSNWPNHATTGTRISNVEYEGSMMYDERPDYETVLRIRDKVLDAYKELIQMQI